MSPRKKVVQLALPVEDEDEDATAVPMPASRVPRSGTPGSAEEGTRETIWHKVGGPNDYVSVYRLNEIKQKNETHGRIQQDEAEPDLIAARWGGGTYQLRLLMQTDTGGFQIGEAHTIVVPGTYYPPEGLPGLPNMKPRQIAADPVAAAAQTLPPVGQQNEMLNAVMMSQVMDIVKLSKQVREAQPGPDMSMVNVLAEVLREMREDRKAMLAVLTAPVSPAAVMLPTMAEKLAELKALKDLFQPAVVSQAAPAVASSLDEALKIYHAVRGVSGEVGDSGTGDPMLDALPKVLEIVSEEQAQRRAHNAPPMTARRGAPAPRTVVATPVTPPPTPEAPVTPLEPWQQILRKDGPRLTIAAVAGRDPVKMATVALNMAPDTMIEIIATFFEREDAEERMLEEVPGLATHRAWVEAFVAATRDMLFEEEGEEDAEGPEEETPDTGAAPITLTGGDDDPEE